MSKRRRNTLVVATVAAGVLGAAAASRGGEHREVLAELRGSTVSWSQPDLRGGYPMGCGPTAWAIVYAYWAQNHGAGGLFPGYTIDATNAGSDDPAVMAVMEGVAGLVQTEYFEKGGPVKVDGTKVFERGSRVKLGGTSAYDMCPGIRYAQEHGFPHSRCFRIVGSEFDKFDHIRRHLEANRPVILNISTKGHRATNHYVVAEKARKIQEKVGGQWRDRDVEYFVNYGWGGSRGEMPEWISARQVGVNTEQVYTVTHAFLINVSATPLPMATDANEEACREWCEGSDGRQAGCKACSKLAGCGPGYRHLASFTGAEINWYACAPRDTQRAEASEGHREACEEWCRGNPECKTCSTQAGCGPGYRSIKSWTGYGNNFYACAEREPTRRAQASERHQNECQEWCASHSECVKCSDQAGCGIGFESLKSWTGFGRNWQACGQTRRQDASDQHKADCETWCAATAGCEMCSTRPQCGPGYEPLRGWTGYGRNWYACAKRQSRAEASRGNKEECEAWCQSHSECATCSRLYGCGSGYKHLKSFSGRGDNWHACEKR